jgi:signal transduction histidine kinase
MDSPSPAPSRGRRRLHLPRRTVRLRLTLLYGGVFVLSGAVLLAVAYLLVGQTTSGPNYSAGITAKGVIVKGPSGNVSLGPLAGARLVTPAGESAGGSSPVRPSPGGKGGPAPLLYGNGGNGSGSAQHGGGLQFPGGGLETVDQAREQERRLQLQTLEQARAQARKLEALGRQQHKEEMHRLLVDLGIALAIVAVLSLGLGWFLAGRLLRPLQTITTAVRAISAKSLHRRLALRGPRDELREVGDTFDELLERLERSFEAQRQFAANASHELRTPLTLERAVVEVALADPQASNQTLRATCERVLAIGAEQERLIDALLALARSERGLERADQLDLARLATDVLAAREPEIAERGLRLETDLQAAPTIGDARLAERLVANLLDNALRYNAGSGWVRVTSATADGRAILTVANSGPVVPEQEVERLFQPFRRLGVARASQGEGHGLGLSIVSAIAAAHGAELQASAPAGGGLQISVGFPAAAAGGAAQSPARATVAAGAAGPSRL